MDTSKRTQDLPMTFPEPSSRVQSGLLNHKSSSTNRVEEKIISGNRSTCWAHFCGVALKLRQISWHVPNSLHVGPNMANFQGSLRVYFTWLCSKYPLIQFLLVRHSFVMFFFLNFVHSNFRPHGSERDAPLYNGFLFQRNPEQDSSTPYTPYPFYPTFKSSVV